MEEKNEPDLVVIENATLDDVVPGDRITWVRAFEVSGVDHMTRREGIAHHRNDHGNWCNEGGIWIADGKGEGITITVRRAAREVPSNPGTVLVPAVKGARIVAVTEEGTTYHADHAVVVYLGMAAAAWRNPADNADTRSTVHGTQISPGTWKIEEN